MSVNGIVTTIWMRMRILGPTGKLALFAATQLTLLHVPLGETILGLNSDMQLVLQLVEVFRSI
jgi:hypothetical protein